MKTNKLLPLILLICLILAACNLPSSQPGSPGMLRAWIDAPLDGSHLPLATVMVVYHGGAPLGVAQTEFSVDGRVIDLHPNPDPHLKLVNIQTEWTPTITGTYVVGVRTQDVSGNWSAAALATVIIEATQTPTGEATLTPTPEITQTPTPTPTQPATIAFGQPQVSTYVFEYMYDCVPDPAEVTLQVALPDAPAETFVFFFFRLKILPGNTYTEWNNGLPMTALGGSQYRITIKSQDIPGATNLKGAQAEFQYQFVATGTEGAILLKSPVYSDIQLKRCQ